MVDHNIVCGNDQKRRVVAMCELGDRPCHQELPVASSLRHSLKFNKDYCVVGQSANVGGAEALP